MVLEGGDREGGRQVAPGTRILMTVLTVVELNRTCTMFEQTTGMGDPHNYYSSDVRLIEKFDGTSFLENGNFNDTDTSRALKVLLK